MAARKDEHRRTEPSEIAVPLGLSAFGLGFRA